MAEEAETTLSEPTEKTKELQDTNDNGVHNPFSEEDKENLEDQHHQENGEEQQHQVNEELQQHESGEMEEVDLEEVKLDEPNVPIVETTSEDAKVETHEKDDKNPFVTSDSGSETYIGANEENGLDHGDTVGSRLAAPDVTAGSLSPNNPNRSPIYSPPLNNNNVTKKVHMGFGNTNSPSASPKLSNITLQDFQQAASGRAEKMKMWSVKAFKCTKQVLSEKLGKGQKTVDLELEAKIEILKDTKRKYENLLNLIKLLSKHFHSIIATQQQLGSALAELSAKSQELQDEFHCNAESQTVFAKNGQSLMSALDCFVTGVSTLCEKTMEDTLLTISKYEVARLTYDAYKNELTAIKLRARTPSNIAKQAIAQDKFDTNQAAYTQLRNDVAIKLQFLDENRVKVMQNHLLLLNAAIGAYFTGDRENLEEALKQFQLSRGGAAPSSSQTSIQ